MRWFTGTYNSEEQLKKEYKKLVKKLHPDISGYDSTEEFKQMQNEFEKLSQSFGCTDTQEFTDIVNDLIKYGVDVEIIGTWLWLHNTKRDDADLYKAFGFKWSGKRKLWYKAPRNSKIRFSKHHIAMNRMRALYGSEYISSKDGNLATA